MTLPNDIAVSVEGGCPKCGNQDIEVREDWAADTVIKCMKCGHQATHAEFFNEPMGDPPGEC